MSELKLFMTSDADIMTSKSAFQCQPPPCSNTVRISLLRCIVASGSQPATRFEDGFLTAQQLCSVYQVKMEPRHGIMKAFPKVKRAKILNRKDAPPVKKKLDECDVTGCYSD